MTLQFENATYCDSTEFNQNWRRKICDLTWSYAICWCKIFWYKIYRNRRKCGCRLRWCDIPESGLCEWKLCFIVWLKPWCVCDSKPWDALWKLHLTRGDIAACASQVFMKTHFVIRTSWAAMFFLKKYLIIHVTIRSLHRLRSSSKADVLHNQLDSSPASCTWCKTAQRQEPSNRSWFLIFLKWCKCTKMSQIYCTGY